MMEKRNVARTDWFVAAGIDDLAKYRIVELLMRTPGVSGSAHFFADTLGLRPVDLVRQLLDELVEQGLCIPAGSNSLVPIYTMNEDRSTRQHLEQLYSLSADPTLREPLLNQLARRSLCKVAAMAQQRQASCQADQQQEAPTGEPKARQPRSRTTSVA